jgi:hypothetical protein
MANASRAASGDDNRRVARRILRNRLLRASGCERQRSALTGIAKQTAELGPGRARLEVLCVQVLWQRQRYRQIDAQIFGHQGHNAIRAFGERRHELQRPVGKTQRQVLE